MTGWQPMQPEVRRLLDRFRVVKDAYLATRSTEDAIRVLDELADESEQFTQLFSELATLCRLAADELRKEEDRTNQSEQDES
jgi:hypothetical protein